MGLIIHKIEPSGRIFKDGRIKPGDRIVEINEKTLIGIDFKKSQEILREALKTSINQNGILDFKLIRNIDIFNKYLANIQIEKQEEEINEKQIEILNDDDTETINSQYENETSCDTTNQQITNSFSNNSLSLSNINALNTRKIGNKVTIQLIKGTDGLGFKLAARDYCTPGEFSPIYVKNILPKGAAIQDGRLQRGDRLLEVNKIDMTQKTVNEAVNILRNTKMDSCVELIVSRQNASNNNTSISMKSNNNLAEPFDQNDVADVENKNEEPKKFKNTKETLILDIQLNDTGSAGLGVSVKGKTKKNNDEKIIDLGIFVKTVINGGAASKDGRLKQNDQLVKINGVSLLNKSNEAAMQILRESMQIESSKPGHIELVVTRKKNSTKENYNNLMQPLTTDNNNTNNSRQVLKLIKNDNENNNNNKDELNVTNTARFNRDAPSRRSVSEKRTKIGSSGSSTSTINKFQRKSSIQKTPIAFSNFNENNNNGENSQNDGSISQKCPSNYENKEDEFKKQNHSCNIILFLIKNDLINFNLPKTFN
jgi:partitioning defective protein 3